MHNTVSEFYKKLLGTYFDEYYYLSDAERQKKWIARINLKKVIYWRI